MAVKMGRFTDFRAVLVEYGWKSNGLNKLCLTHVLGNLKLLISAFKVGKFYYLVTDFEKHCCLSARKESL